ncbi:MAG: hypothetical protein QXL85_06645 [Candidatus Bathyarchaeia archaeon]
MEQAIYLTKVSQLKYLGTEFSRIYFGNEFCERLLPGLEDLEKVINFVFRMELEFTFLTPYVTNRGLKSLISLLDIIAQECPNSEVVFNDYGVLRVLLNTYSSLKPVMGRLLNRMKRGPRLMNFIEALPETTIKYFRSSSIDTPEFSNFLLSKGIRRIELDNLLQGIDLNLRKFGISASLYVPYAYVTTTRICLAINCDEHGKEDIVGIFPCKRECQKYTFYLNNRVMPVTLIRKGNTVFFKNEKIPSNLDSMGVDRIVYEPELPI